MIHSRFFYAALSHKDIAGQSNSWKNDADYAIEKNKKFDDFVGNNGKVTFQFSDFKKIYFLIRALECGESLKRIWEAIFQKDSDEFARAACYAFKNNQLTQAEVATILNLRQIVAITSIGDGGHWDIEPLVAPSDLLEFFSNSKSSEALESLDDLPSSEKCCFRVTINTDVLNDDRLLKLLSLGYQLGVVYFDQHQRGTLFKLINPPYRSDASHLTFSVASAGAMNIFTRLRYGRHAKKLLPRLGAISIDDIKNGMQNKARYAAFSHPDISDCEIFHDIQAPVFYMSLHDELHRQLISSIPNKVYQAYQLAIQLIIEKTQFVWTAELWKAVDLEVGSLLAITPAQRDSCAPQRITNHFCKLLSSRIYSTGERIGLFDPEAPYLDTTFILLIDIYKNPKKWQLYKIDQQFLTEHYRTLFEFLMENKNIIDMDEVGPHEIAQLKAKYLNIYVANTISSVFIKKDRYLQLQTSQVILGETKAMNLALENYQVAYSMLLNEMNSLSLFHEHIETHDKAKAIAKSINDRMSNKTGIGFFSRFESKTLAEIKFLTDSLRLTQQLLNPMNQKNPDFKKNHSELIGKIQSLPSPRVKDTMLRFITGQKIFLAATNFGLTSAVSAMGKKDRIVAGFGIFKTQLQSVATAGYHGLLRYSGVMNIR